MRRSLVLRISAVALCTVAGLIVALVATVSSGGVERLGVVALAAKRTQAAGTARFALSVSITATTDGKQESGSIAASGATELHGDRSRVNLDLTGLNGIEDVDAVPEGWLTADLITDGSAAYVRSPVASLALQQFRPWLKLDVTRLQARFEAIAKAMGETDLESKRARQLALAAGLDPANALELLDRIGSFSAAGKEDVRGVATTRYTGTLDFSKALDLIPGLDPSERADALKGIAESGVTGVPLTVWIGDDGRFRKLSTTITDLPDMQAGDRFAVTFELYDYGTEIDTTPPPADLTADATPKVMELLDQAAGTLFTPGLAAGGSSSNQSFDGVFDAPFRGEFDPEEEYGTVVYESGS